MESTGIKKDDGKVRMDLLPPRALIEVAKTYTYGAGKYADFNWQNGIAWSRIYAAAQRHLHAFWMGEDLDPESCLYHLAHAVFNCLTLIEYYRTHPELDDRMYDESKEESEEDPHV